jgi:hypothetical protein
MQPHQDIQLPPQDTHSLTRDSRKTHFQRHSVLAAASPGKRQLAPLKLRLTRHSPYGAVPSKRKKNLVVVLSPSFFEVWYSAGSPWIVRRVACFQPGLQARLFRILIGYYLNGTKFSTV